MCREIAEAFEDVETFGRARNGCYSAAFSSLTDDADTMSTTMMGANRVIGETMAKGDGILYLVSQ